MFTVGPPGAYPPKAKAAVLVPAPATRYLAVPKSFTSVQLVPFQFSVLFLAGDAFPPKAKAAVLIPAAPAICLEVCKLFTSVQLVPLYNSVRFDTSGGVPSFPAKAKAAV